MSEKYNHKNSKHLEQLEEEKNDLLDKCNQIFIKIRSDFNLKFPTDQYVIFNRQYANHMKKEFDLFSMCLEEVYQTFEIDGEKYMSQFLNNILLTTKCMLFTQLRCFLNYLDQNIQLNDSKPLSNWEASEMQKMSRHKVKVLRGTTDAELIKAQQSNLINDPSDEIKKRLGIEMDPLLRENQLSKKELLEALDEKRRNLSMRESKANRYIKQSLVGIKNQLQKEKTFVADFEEKYLQALKRTIFQDGGQQAAGILDEITNNLDKNAKQKFVKVLEFLFNSTKDIQTNKKNAGVQTTLVGNAIDESEGKMAKLSRKIYDQDRSIEQLLKDQNTKDVKINSLEKELNTLKNKAAKDNDSTLQLKAEEYQKQLDKINKQLNEALEDKAYYQNQLANARKEENNKGSFMNKNSKNTKNSNANNTSQQQQQQSQQESQKSSQQKNSQQQSSQQQVLVPSQASSQSLQTQLDEQFQQQQQTQQQGQLSDRAKGLTVNTRSSNLLQNNQNGQSNKQLSSSNLNVINNNNNLIPSFQDLNGAHSPSQSVSNLLSPQTATKQQLTQQIVSSTAIAGAASGTQMKSKPGFFSDQNQVSSPESKQGTSSVNEGHIQQSQQQYQQQYNKDNNSNLASVFDSSLQGQHENHLQEEENTHDENQQQTENAHQNNTKSKHKGNSKSVKQTSDHNETSYISGTTNQTATHRSNNQQASSPINYLPEQASNNDSKKDQTTHASSQQQTKQQNHSKSQQQQTNVQGQSSTVQQQQQEKSQQNQSQLTSHIQNKSQSPLPQQHQQQGQDKNQQKQSSKSQNPSQPTEDNSQLVQSKQTKINENQTSKNQSKEPKQQNNQEKNSVSSSILSQLGTITQQGGISSQLTNGTQKQTAHNVQTSSLSMQSQQRRPSIKINKSELIQKDDQNLGNTKTDSITVNYEQTKVAQEQQYQQSTDPKESQKQQQLLSPDSSSVLPSTVITSAPNLTQISMNINNNSTNLGSVGVLTFTDNLRGVDQNQISQQQVSQNTLSPRNVLGDVTVSLDGNNNSTILEGQNSSTFRNALGMNDRQQDGDITINNSNIDKHQSRVDVKGILDLFDLENESSQPSQSAQILEVLQNKRNPKRREVINAIVEVINRKKVDEKYKSKQAKIDQEDDREDDLEEEENDLASQQQGIKQRKNLHLTEKKQRKGQNSSGFTSSDQGQIQTNKYTAATSFSSTATLSAFKSNGENANIVSDTDLISSNNQQNSYIVKNNFSNKSDKDNSSSNKYASASMSLNNSHRNQLLNRSTQDLDSQKQEKWQSVERTTDNDRYKKQQYGSSQGDAIFYEGKGLKQQYMTQATFKDSSRAQQYTEKQKQKYLSQQDQLGNFEEDPDVLARLVQKQEVIQDIIRKKNQMAMSRFQVQGDIASSLSSTSMFNEKHRGSQVSINGSSSMINLDGNQQTRNQGQGLWKQKDEFRIIDSKSPSNLLNGGQISSSSKLDYIDPFRKNTNPSKTQGTIVKKPPPFNEDEHFIKDLYEHMKIGQIDLAQLKELDMQGGSAPKIQHRDEQLQPNIKILNSGRVVDTNNIKYDEFADFYSDVLQQHRRCGPFCYHLKRFYEKMNFNVKAYQNRQALVCPTLVVQEVQKETKKQSAKFNLKNPSTHN